MIFDLRGKVALITGGASGIGLECAKELLRNGVKGVTLVDIDVQSGQFAIEEIETEFGGNRAIFIEADITDIRQFDGAFKKTLEVFNYIDILFNNAGVLNDQEWENEVAVNVKGVIHGMLLGIEHYLQKYRQGPEAVIMNTSSIAILGGHSFAPIYCGTKAAVVAMTRSWGVPEHYQRTNVRVLAICPGGTNTSLVFNIPGKNLGEPYQELLENAALARPITQEPEHLASEMVKLVVNGENGTIWVVNEGNPAYQVVMPDTTILFSKI